ncbi:MAG TPA: 3-oxoacyl-[acyl-carrier-protein] synthase III C-terminal domain-containing protein [Candidatus Acidoferrales bacterium]|jgi:predicted naringenin-chalcone synthase|nr:3-oxoacyl-[acyl-carrier-protein] synthase III C-terminal domain-containing protein [Candidatus Acidoferrales bacterium]
MFIIGIGTATPPRRYSQVDCWQTVQHCPRFHELNARSKAILKKVLTGENGIATRHFALEKLEEAFQLNPDALHDRFVKNAPALAVVAAERALAQSKTNPREIDAVLVSTCTGYLCPGLSSYVIERLALRPDVVALDLVGQGCGAAIPNLDTARTLLAAGQCRRALSICVEICSAAFYLDDDVGVLISACLFGDGAGAAVVSPEANGGRRVKWNVGGSFMKPADRDSLRMEQKSGMLRNILTPQVPSLAAQSVGSLFDNTLARAGVPRDQVNGWIFHPGGRDVLLALRERFNLSGHDVRWSQAVLREYGNMSSPSVLFALQAALNDGAPDGLWWISSFGAGFSCYGALLEVERP